MKYSDISTDTKNTYRLKANEKAAFFMLNRQGVITFELAGSGAEAHIFSFFIGHGTDRAELKTIQKHLAPKTVSHALMKSVVSDTAECAYDGLIFMDKQAEQSDASQESRAILLSPNTKVSLKPKLEILANDVQCRHAATASPLNPEALFFAASRGLTPSQTSTLLIRGFFNEALERMEELGVDTIEIKKSLEIRY